MSTLWAICLKLLSDPEKRSTQSLIEFASLHIPKILKPKISPKFLSSKHRRGTKKPRTLVEI